VNGFPLKVDAVGDVDQEIEEGFSDSYCLDEQREPIGCSLEAVKTYDEDAVEEAYGRKIM